MNIPEDLRYTAEHEWIRLGDDGSTVRVGITDHAQNALGDVVYVTLPDVGAEARAGQPLGEVESTKSVSDVYAPVAGEVRARNDVLGEHPELVNSDPYGEGWLVEIAVADRSAVDALLDAAAYQEIAEKL